MEMSGMVKLFRALVVVFALLALMGQRRAQAYPENQAPEGYAVTHRLISNEANAEGSEFVWVNDPIVESTGASAHIRGMVDTDVGQYTDLVEHGWQKNLTQPELPESPVPFYNIRGDFGQWYGYCKYWSICPITVGNEHHFAVLLVWINYEPYWEVQFDYTMYVRVCVNCSTGEDRLPYVWAGIETLDDVDPDIHVAGPLTTKTNVYRDAIYNQWHLWYRDRSKEQFSDPDHYCLYSWQGSDANLLLFGGRGIDCWDE